MRACVLDMISARQHVDPSGSSSSFSSGSAAIAQADGAMLVVSCLSMHMRAMHGTPYYSLSHNMCGIQLVVLDGTFVPS